jgi:hypothetical protein
VDQDRIALPESSSSFSSSPIGSRVRIVGILSPTVFGYAQCYQRSNEFSVKEVQSGLLKSQIENVDGTPHHSRARDALHCAHCIARL